MGFKITSSANLHFWRPFSDWSAAQGVVFTPSNMFPGGVDGGHRLCLCSGGGQGLDCFFPIFLGPSMLMSMTNFLLILDLFVNRSVTAWV
jgi:hypothetical protein